MLTIALLLTFAFAAEAGEVKANLATDDYGLAAHLKSIPAEYRKQVKATHHLAVIVSDTKGDQVTNAVVSFAFKQGDKVLAEGKLAYMAAAMPGGHGGHHQNDRADHGGAIPMCEGNPNCKNPSCPHKAAAAGGHYGADITLASTGKMTMTLFVKIDSDVQSASAEIVVPE